MRLAKAGLRGARVWARAKLNRVLRDHAWIRQIYFGHQLVPGLVPLAHPCELDDPSQPDIELVGRSTERTVLRCFIEGAPRIGVIVAAGGSGKTRLLRALPELLWGTRPRRSVWLRRPGQGSLGEAFLNGLPVRKPMVITLDDAAQAPEELTELARLAVDQTSVDVKLVVSIRTVDRESISLALAKFRFAVAYIDLEELSTEDAAHIARVECPALQPGDASRLAREFGSNLFLLRAAAQQLCRGVHPGTVVDDEHIRRLVAARLIEEAERQLLSLADQRQTQRLLSEIALNVPLPFVRAKDSEAIKALYHSGVLRRIGNTLRFRRDVEGDLLLAYLLEQAAQRAIIEHLFATQTGGDDIQRKLRNLSAAGSGYAATMICELTQRWLAEPVGSLSQRIRLLPYCAEAAPEQVAKICIKAAHARALTAGEVGSIVLALGHSDAVRGLRLLWELAVLDPTAASLSVHDVVNRLLNPYFHKHDELTGACLLLEAWLREASPTCGRRAEVLAEALRALFRTVAAWDTYDGASFTIHEQELPATPRLLQIRRTATQLLGEMIAHPETELRRRAITILERHGAPHIGRVATQAFHSAAADEFKLLVPIIEARFTAETEASLLSAIYMSLATRWAIGWPGADDAGRLLVGQSIDPLIKAYHYSSRDEWFYSFDEVLATAPEDDRWSWWIQRYLRSRSVDECARVVSDLCARYRTVGEIAHAILALAGADRPEWIIDAWCCREPALFEQALHVISNERAYRYVEGALRRDRYRINPEVIIDDLEAMPHPVSMDDANLVLNTANLNAAVLAIAVARHLVNQPDIEVRRRGLDCIDHRSDADPSVVLDILEHALRDGDWGKHWDAILYVLENPGRRLLIADRTALHQRIEERFLVGKEWIGHDWYEERVLGLLYDGDQERKLNLLGRLLTKGTFGAVQEVGLLIAPLVLETTQFRNVIERLVSWARRLGEKGIDRVESVLQTALHDKALPDVAFTVAMDMLRGSDTVAREMALVLLTELQTDPEACATLARIAAGNSDGLRERAASRLRSFRWPRGGLSRTIGQPPEKLVHLEQVLQQAQQLVSGDARLLVAEVLHDVEQDLERYRLTDEEALMSR